MTLRRTFVWCAALASLGCRDVPVASAVADRASASRPLLCGDTMLAEYVDVRALSPDERYVVYSDGRGHNFVHGAESGQARGATPTPYALPSSVRWDLAHEQVTVTFAKAAPITVALP